MYPKYFGLREASFSITPDPQYLYLSGQHREALAHLLFGAGDGGGFVLLTGEVGTGKTTVCRAFLEQLPEGVEVALVVNPAMTATELLHAICDEFRIELPGTDPSVKSMLDHLNHYLLDAHARGQRPVLIIDEAQNLRPKVLEQIRLLTNLETAKRKLLQIFLIGQPELRVLLASRDLRQLNQRITARYHLQPLSAKETAAYVDHRIAVAGVDRPLFTASALKRVHRVTGGVPRLINLVCERALLGAAVSRRLQVTPDVVTHAAREVIDRRDPSAPKPPRALGMAAALLLALGLGTFIGGSGALERLRDTIPTEWLAGVGLPATDAADAEPAALAATADPGPTPGADDAPAQPNAMAEPTTDDADAAPVGKIASVMVDSPENSGPETDPEVMAEVPLAEPDDAPLAPLDSPTETLASEEGPSPTTHVTPAAESQRPVLVAEGEQQETPPADDLAVEPLGEPAKEPTARSTKVPRIATARLNTEVSSIDADALGDALIDRRSVVDELLRLWQVDMAPGVRHLDCAAVPAFALACERGAGRWSDLRRFDRPAALKLALADGGVGFAVVVGLDDEHALLQRRSGLAMVPIATLDERWSGDYLLLWRPPPFGGNIIGPRTAPDAVAWLRERLALLPDSTLTVDPSRYDADVKATVRQFQTQNDLTDDGIAGPRTLIMLSNALADLDVPRLSTNR